MKPLTEGKTLGGMGSKKITRNSRPTSPPPAPTSIRRAGVSIWYIDHVRNELKPGVLVTTENQSGRDEQPSLLVLGKHGNSRVLEEWVFTSEKEAQAGLKQYICQKIKYKQEELRALKAKL